MRTLLLLLTFSLSTLTFAQQPNSRQLSSLGISGATLSQVRGGIWAVKLNGKAAGHIVNSQEFAADVRGFKGATPVLVYVDKKRTVKKIYAFPNQETPQYFQHAQDVLKKYEGKSAKTGKTAKVNAVTGATFSSNSLIKNVDAALAAYNKYVK